MLPVSDMAGRRLLMTADAVGGVWTYALDLAEGLAARGVRVVLAVMGPAPSPAQRASAMALRGVRLVETGLAVDWLADSPEQVRDSGRALAALAAEYGADVVHLNTAGPAVADFPVPVLVACHSCLATWWREMRAGPMPADFRWRAALVTEAYGRAGMLVAPSAAFAGATREAHGLHATPHVVHNGRRAVAARPVAEAPIAFTAGRLWDEGKDAATLDRAAAFLPFPLHAAGPVAGPNGTRVELRHLALLGGLPPEAVARHLAARPVFVSAARYEPFGLAVLEAAQAGSALVLADTPVFRELWDGAAHFVPAGDAAGFADAIRRLATDRERRAALGVTAQERAGRYGPDAQVAAMFALYRGLLGATQGRDVAA